MKAPKATKTSKPHTPKRSKQPAPAVALPTTELEKRAMAAQLGAPVTAAPVKVAPVRPVRSLADKLGSDLLSYLRVHQRRPYGERGMRALDRLILAYRDALGEQADAVIASHPAVVAYVTARASAASQTADTV
jgi:hypothetical protein